MAEYSYQDLMKMQNDAIRRAEDMQRRARQSAGLEREKGENLQNQTAKKEEPRRIPMPNDYLENLVQIDGKEKSYISFEVGGINFYVHVFGSFSKDMKKLFNINIKEKAN